MPEGLKLLCAESGGHQWVNGAASKENSDRNAVLHLGTGGHSLCWGWDVSLHPPGVDLGLLVADPHLELLVADPHLGLLVTDPHLELLVTDPH